MRETETRNVLVIGDLHEPFCKDGYLEFCQEQYDTWNCNQVIYIGDIIDNHYTSFHEIDIEAEYTGKQELEYAIKKLLGWKKIELFNCNRFCKISWLINVSSKG